MLMRLACYFLGGHRFRVVQQFSTTSRRVVCDRCKQDWGMNDSVRAMVPWDSDLESMYRDLFNIQILPPF